jgi:hypothetical protein
MPISANKEEQRLRKNIRSRELYRQNRAKRLLQCAAYNRTRKASDPQRVKAIRLEWERKNRNRINTLKRVRRAINKSEGKAERSYQTPEKKQAYYAANKAKWREQYRKWSAANPDKEAARVARRRAGINTATPKWADLAAIRRVYSEARKTSLATGFIHHVDHVIPLNGEIVSGLHWEGNLQILPWADNVKKSNQLCQ